MYKLKTICLKSLCYSTSKMLIQKTNYKTIPIKHLKFSTKTETKERTPIEQVILGTLQGISIGFIILGISTLVQGTARILSGPDWVSICEGNDCDNPDCECECCNRPDYK